MCYCMRADIFAELHSVHLSLASTVEYDAAFLDNSHRRCVFRLAHVSRRRQDESHKLAFMAEICFLLGQFTGTVGLKHAHTTRTMLTMRIEINVPGSWR